MMRVEMAMEIQVNRMYQSKGGLIKTVCLESMNVGRLQIWSVACSLGGILNR